MRLINFTEEGAGMVMRIGTGLSTGNDNQAIIEAMLKAKRAPAENLEKAAEKLEKVATKWSEAADKTSKLMDAADSLGSISVWNQKSARGSDKGIAPSVTDSRQAVNGDYQVSVTALAQADRYNSRQYEPTQALGFQGSFSVNGTSLTVGAQDTVETVAASINYSVQSARAYVAGGSLFIRSTCTGASNSLTLCDGSGILAGIGLLDNHSAGSNLSGAVEGVGVSSGTNSGVGTFVGGLSMSFSATGSFSVSVSNDTDTLKSLIKSFVTAYNDFMDFMSSATSVSLNQQSSVASVGYLQGDGTAQRLQYGATTAVTFGFGLASIGISFTSGRLSIDDASLDRALSDDFDRVAKLLRGSDGVAKKLSAFLRKQVDPIDGPVTGRERSASSEASEKRRRVARIDDDLRGQETALYAHFAASENAIARSSAQSQYVQRLFGG